MEERVGILGYWNWFHFLLREAIVQGSCYVVVKAVRFDRVHRSWLLTEEATRDVKVHRTAAYAIIGCDEGIGIDRF